MKGIAKTICLLLGLLAVRTVGGQQQQQQQQQQQWEHVVKTCADLPSSELTGITTLSNPISCDPPVMLHVREEALLRSDGVIETTGVHFMVHEHGTLHASGKAIDMRRMTDMPPHLHLIMAHGRFNLHVTDYISSIAGAAEDDKHAIVWEGAEGLFQSKHSMVRFTEHSMVVSKIPTANEIKRTETNDFSLLDTRAKRELLASIHAELRARVGLGEAETKPAPPTVTLPAEVLNQEDEGKRGIASDGTYPVETTAAASDSTVPVPDLNADQLGSTDIFDQGSIPQTAPPPTPSPTSVTSSNGGSSGYDLSSSPPPPTVPTNNDQQRPPREMGHDMNTLNIDTSTTTSSTEVGPSTIISGSSFPRTPGDRCESKRCTTKGSFPDDGNMASPSTDHLDVSSESNMNNEHAGSDSGSSSSSSGSSKDSRSGSGGSSSNDGRSGSGADGGGETGDNEESAPSSNMKVHPALSLKVGEVLSGTLLSPSMGSRIFASREDGAISFAKATGKPPRDAGGRVTGPTPETITTLVASDPGKVAKRHAMRAELLAEELYDRTAQAEGKSGKRGLLAMIAGWMPFGKGGFLRRRAQEHAKAHIGEVNLYVTNRGHLEGSVDGTRVARKSGPSWFGYRRKDPSYELWVTHSGVDITRNGMLDWRIEAENKV